MRMVEDGIQEQQQVETEEHMLFESNQYGEEFSTNNISLALSKFL